MRLIIGEYEVEVKALNTVHSNQTKMNKHDTMYFLNYIASLASEASEKLNEDGFEWLSKTARQYNNDIYNELKKLGLYD